MKVYTLFYPTLRSHIFLMVSTFKNFQNPFLKKYKHNLNKQPLMMAYERSESARDNFGKFIYQFQPETKTFIRKPERILNKLYW